MQKQGRAVWKQHQKRLGYYLKRIVLTFSILCQNPCLLIYFLGKKYYVLYIFINLFGTYLIVNCTTSSKYLFSKTNSIDCFWHMLTVNFSVKTHAIIQYFTSCPKKMERALLYQVTKLPLIYLCKKEPAL